ncbi:hypothetical protein [Sulfitobacter sp. 915]|uniref:hypothetical protein n=1 Tax=Sulfitobacter sp. 915 TaxID=3368558 RepID=UPI003745A644
MDVIPGGYELTISEVDDTARQVVLIDILPASSNDIANHADAAPPPLNVWQQCDTAVACDVEDPRVGLSGRVPGGWATEEPFYYTTAGGSQGERPTVVMHDTQKRVPRCL